METNSATESSERRPLKSRICLPSARNFKKETFLCGNYEAQDVLVDTDDVDLICLEAGRAYKVKDRWQRRLIFRDVSRRIIFVNPGLRNVTLNAEYDLFLVRCQTEKDLPDINAIKQWKNSCKTKVCWIDELWAALLPNNKYWLHALNQFDHVFTSCLGTVGPLCQALGRPIHWLPGGVDALRFVPYPDPPVRVIDIYSIGRRHTGIHRKMLQAAKGKGVFYIHDTVQASLSDVYDYREHRDHFANLAKRSRYFMVAPGKIDVTSESQGQSEVGHRYYEGTAAGAVLIGQAPHTASFKQLFPWPDAVVRVEPDGSDVLDVLTTLDSDPARVAAASQRNVLGALLRHDWVYRWKELLRIAGLEPSRRMLERERHLKHLASIVAAAAYPEALLKEMGSVSYDTAGHASVGLRPAYSETASEKRPFNEVLKSRTE